MRWCVATLVLGGCIEPRAFPCERTEQCVLDGMEGECEVEVGYCSYPDEDCDSGKRFEARAVGLEGECVPPEDEPNCVWSSVHVGGSFACGRDAFGAVYCWGANDQGQLGIGEEIAYAPDPRAVGIVAEDLAADGHACALQTGSLSCWGPNDAGQIDMIASTDPKRAPVPIDSVGTVDAVLVGGRRTCISQGTLVQCWGFALPAPPEPLYALPLPERPSSVASGTNHVCGVLENATVGCVGGDNDRNQLGEGGTPTGPVIVPVGGVPIALDVGDDHTCVIVATDAGRDARSVVCWGENSSMQAGGTVDMPIVPMPTAVVGLPLREWTDVATASQHTCVLEASGAIWCWGDNAYGRAHPSPTSPWTKAAAPIAIAGHDPLDALDISAGTTSTCAVWLDGRLSCWGCLSADACADTGTVRDFDCPAP